MEADVGEDVGAEFVDVGEAADVEEVGLAGAVIAGAVGEMHWQTASAAEDAAIPVANPQLLSTQSKAKA